MSRPIPVSVARRIAYDILSEVAGGAFATDLLLERTAGLESRDAGLASQLVFGCLRFQGQLDYLIERYSGRKVKDLDVPVVILLRTGIYQLRYLDRIPAHAAVHETVELVKKHKRAAAGFVNAVLRKVKRTPVAWPNLATELSCPEWLIKRWTTHFGAAAAEEIARAALREPRRYIRVAPGAAPPPAVELQPTDLTGCLEVTGGDWTGLRLQDIGAQSLVPLLELEPGQTFLDLCAAPGNKTTQALEIEIRGVSCDISFRRLKDVPPLCPRVVLDATRPLPFREQFDRILVDAPCSGTGTLSRNPEIKWRVTIGDIERHRAQQERILAQALQWLKPGGKLVYATCSLEEEENEGVVRDVVAGQPKAKLLTEKWRLPGRDPGDGFFAAVLTSSD